MKLWKMSLASLAIAALPAVASAQQVVTSTVERQPVTIDLSAESGILVPTLGGLNDAGFAYGAKVGINLGRFLAIEGRYLGSIHGETEIDGATTNFNSAAVDLKLMAMPERSIGVTPYVTAGLGVYRFRGGAVEGPGSLLENTNAQIPVGVGLMANITPNVGIGGEFMYHFLLDNGLFNSPDRAATDVWQATANLIFRL
jgi:hypothetical protein